MLKKPLAALGAVALVSTSVPAAHAESPADHTLKDAFVMSMIPVALVSGLVSWITGGPVCISGTNLGRGGSC